MAYFKPYINDSGLHISTFPDTLAYLQGAFQAIYGTDIVLDNSTQDGQLCAVFAQAIYDNALALQGVYNQFSPATAIGAGLSSVVQINGVNRQSATYSTVDVVLTGLPNTQIPSGVVQDTVFNNKWSLPASVIIGSSGSVTATATSQTPGAISAAANTVTKILTPIAGWSTVNNPLQANTGNPAETDAALRIRQRFSTAIPSQSILQGLYGELLTISGVTQASVFENQLSTTDTTTIPNRTPNSIACVVAGGSNQDIARSIYNNKTIGTNSAGFVSGTPGLNTVTISNPGVGPIAISFYRPSPVNVSVTVNVRELNGWVNSTDNLIANIVARYITDDIFIGQDVFNTRVVRAAYDTELGYTYDVSSVVLSAPGKTPDASGNILINDNEESVCVVGNVTVNSVPF